MHLEYELIAGWNQLGHVVRQDVRTRAGRKTAELAKRRLTTGLAPAATTIALGRRAAEWRAEQAVKAIRKVIPTP